MITRREFNWLGLGTAVAANLPFRAFAQNAQSNGANGADIRRVGKRVNGSYWGAKGEKIDLLSGNLNYSVPLLRLASRGAKARVGCSYNSQLWKQDGAGLHSYGVDLGFGYGWRIQIGCIVPQQNPDGSIAGYTFIDGSGAEYSLSQSGNNWVSPDGLYVTWNPASGVLSFRDGSSWTFGCVSGPQDPDAGALYPTLIQCSNGNQIKITYLPGIGQSSPNSSARISHIQDARATDAADGRRSYVFLYDNGQLPHLLSISSRVGTQENYSFSYSAQQLSSPFGDLGDFGTIISTLQSVALPTGQSHVFQYDGFAELVQAQLPHGGVMGWEYSTFTFQDGRSIREVTSRQTMASSSAATVDSYSISRASSDASGDVHGSAILNGPAGTGTRTWLFDSSAASPTCGLLQSETTYDSSGYALRQHSVGWASTDSGIPYVGVHSTVLDPGSANEQTSRMEYTRDSYGNLVQSSQFDYGNPNTPARVVQNTYLSDPAYVQNNILNRRLSTSISNAQQTTQLITNQYDTTPLLGRSGLTEHDSRNYGSGNSVRGNLTESYVGGVYRRVQYDVTGVAANLQDSAGSQVSFVPADGSNNTAIGLVVPNNNANLGLQVQYASGRPVQITKPNGATATIAYDSMGRKASTASADGAVTTFDYGVNPTTTTSTTNGRWKRVTRDGFGRKVLSERGDAGGTQSAVEHEYGPAAGSELGKLKRQSLRHAPGVAPQWVHYHSSLW